MPAAGDRTGTSPSNEQQLARAQRYQTEHATHGREADAHQTEHDSDEHRAVQPRVSSRSSSERFLARGGFDMVPVLVRAALELASIGRARLPLNDDLIQGEPALRPHDPVGNERTFALESAHARFGAGPEFAVDADPKQFLE
jgi:hypothetical protein